MIAIAIIETVSRKASLPQRVFALQINQKRGLQNVAPLRSPLANASATVGMPCQRSGPPSFWLISPEAFLLTAKLSSLLVLQINPKEKTVGLTEKQAGRLDGMTV